MDLAASLALFARGRDQWNIWAAAMVERGRAIVAAGGWGWALDSRSDPYPTNQATKDYRHDAAALFSYHEFVDPPDFSGFVFPGYAAFIGAQFPQGARFRATRFGDGAGFNYARFGATTEFDGVEFCSQGEFCDTEFLGEVSFDQSRFVRGEFEPSSDGRADFSNAKFAKPASFVDMCCGKAVFCETEFEQAVNFAGASFAEMYFIVGAVFRGAVLVRGAQFPYPVDWSDATLAGPPVDATSVNRSVR
jgi:uncharacterized protein YjbI with pentapeptide repeats